MANSKFHIGGAARNGDLFSVDLEKEEAAVTKQEFMNLVSVELEEQSTSPPKTMAQKKSAMELTNFDPNLSQIKRREMTLEWQRKRRDQLIERIRHLDETLSDSESEDMDFCETVVSMKRTRSTRQGQESQSQAHSEGGAGTGNHQHQGPGKQQAGTGAGTRKPRNAKRKEAPCRLMHSEWLTEKPQDFEDKWLAVFCPVGKRVLVVAARGKTRVFTRRNQYLGSFQSYLPGGRRVNYNLDGNRQRGVTVLDCIWSETSETFYALDMITWNSLSFVNCDTEARQFFLQAKISETPELHVPSAKNTFKFSALKMFKADKLDHVLTVGQIEFPEMIDGILLYDKRAFYIFEITPLVLWVMVPDISNILGITPCPEILEKCRPERENARYYLKKPSLMNGAHDEAVEVELIEG